jgi:hypothetical protein
MLSSRQASKRSKLISGTSRNQCQQWPWVAQAAHTSCGTIVSKIGSSEEGDPALTAGSPPRHAPVGLFEEGQGLSLKQAITVSGARTNELRRLRLMARISPLVVIAGGRGSFRHMRVQNQ